MPRFIPRLAFVALILAGILTACDESTLTRPRPFQVVLEVIDSRGRPVSGLELGMAPDTPYYQDGTSPPHRAADAPDQLRQPYPNPFSPSTSIQVQLETSARVTLTVEDVEETTVRTLVDQEYGAGNLVFVWDGRDDSGTLMNSGVYAVRAVVRDAGSDTVRLDDSRPMLMAVFDQLTVGTTDGRGRIVLEDRRLFPYLYDVPEMTAVDETGQVVGTFSLTPTVRFYFTDPVTDDILRYDRDVVSSAALTFVWDPPPVE